MTEALKPTPAEVQRAEDTRIAGAIVSQVEGEEGYHGISGWLKRRFDVANLVDERQQERARERGPSLGGAVTESLSLCPAR